MGHALCIVAVLVMLASYVVIKVTTEILVDSNCAVQSINGSYCL